MAKEILVKLRQVNRQTHRHTETQYMYICTYAYVATMCVGKVMRWCCHTVVRRLTTSMECRDISMFTRD